MIIAQQVKNPMYEQEGKFLFERFSCLTGLSLCGLKRDDHITQKADRVMTDHILALREGHHIG